MSFQSKFYSIHDEEQKEGDAERIKILNLVKDGKLTIEEAMQHAEEMGLGAPSSFDDSISNDAEEKIFNFGVYKYNRHRTSCSRRILQFDFQEKVLCTIQKGARGKKFCFSQIRGFDSEDGVRFFIYIEDHHDYELDADTTEEKNKICTLLESIVQQKKADEPDGVFEMPDFGIEQVIKEGQVEKKGHSAAFMMWPRRWLRIQHGEMAYFKIGEEHQTALNIIKLGPGLAEVKKLDQGGFVVTTSKKEYSFRVMNVNNIKDVQALERERDEWLEAISEASMVSSRRSRATSSFIQDPALTSTVQEQEKYIKDTVKTLLRELEQLTSVLTVVNAPIQATVQVKKVQEVVHDMETQVRTGVLSWAMRELKSRSGSVKSVGSTSSSTLPRSSRKISHPEIMTTPIDEGYESVPSHPAPRVPSQSSPPSEPPPVRPPKGDVQSSYETVPIRPHPTTPPRDSSLQSSPPSAGRCPLSGPIRSTTPILSLAPPSGPALPYDTVTITPRPAPDSSPTPSGKSQGSSSGDIYQQPPSRARQQRDDREVYDNVHIRNVPLIAGKPVAPLTTFTVPVKDDVPNEGDGKGGVEEVDAAKRKRDETQNEIDAGGMKCSSLEEALSERKDLYQDLKTEGAVLLSHTKRTEDAPGSPTEDTPWTSVPPPPPPGPGGIPPPPPPIRGGVPPPPPMGGGSLALDSGLPNRDRLKPNKKLRPFFWNKVPVNLVPKSLWLNAEDQSANLDLSLLEDMFEVEETQKPVVQAAAKPSSKMMLDPKKAHNLGIFLSGFKLTTKEIDTKLSVFRQEEGALPVDHVIALKRFLPTPEEQEMYKNIKLEDVPNLLHEDRFMLKLCEIPDLDKRLDLLLVIMEFPCQYDDLAPAVKGLLEACHELYCSKKFPVVLEYILAIGNYINGGTNRGGAYGLRLTSLPKLADIRGKSKKDTLLRYLISQLRQKCPDTLEMLQELKAVPQASDASIKGLSAEVEVMRKDLAKIKKHSSDLFLKHKRTDTQDVKFFRDVDLFVLEYEEKLKDLCEKCKEMKYIYAKLLARYGEAPNTDSEELLSSISAFLNHFKKALNEGDGEGLPKRRKIEGLSEAVAAHARRKPSEDSVTSPGSPTSPLRDTVDPGAATSASQGGLNDTDGPARHTPPADLKPACPAPICNSPKVIHKQLSVKAPSSSLVTPKVTPRPTRQGYLDKLSGGKHKAPKWDNRYFELTDSGHLHYYKKPDSKIINTIYLRGCPVEMDDEDPAVVIVRTEEREWRLKAVDEVEAQVWREALGFYTEKQTS
ncbi:formin-like protein 6 isoform X2 [Nematostella vectensis]|uniref:formin-like protein 6 isoform X2 n=1 Tax=Nematostella vectensis TaxID=45351 RepID=UPI002076E492|nr:formin-like protein 6 isoform X2 [Nematostella vectensis]